MASVVGAGFDLSFLDKLVSYEKQIEQTKQATIDYGKNAVKIFTDIANNGIEPTLAMLKQQKAEFERLSRINLKGASDEFKALRNEIKNSLDAINPLINALSSVGKSTSSSMTTALEGLEKKIQSLKGNIGVFNELNSAGLATKSDKDEVTRHEAELKRLEAAYLALSNAKKTLSQAQPHTNTVTDQKSLETIRYEDSMRAMREYYKEQERISEENAKKEKKRIEDLAKAKARYDSQSRRDRYSSYVTSYEGALAYADRVSKKNKKQLQNLSTDRDRHSVDNLRKAISNLETAMSKQNQSTKQGRRNYQELEKQLIKTKAEMARLTGEVQKQGPMFGKLGQLATAYFSLSAIKGYVSQMVRVRGEIEKQQKAMQIIIGNKEQANKIWEQTIALSQKSPFTIQELVNHTRQLAAYRVETKKLHDTTKMLADVSAGLGVDMSRLILAFGQVKSASFLRGTELRQFTEAGIPMLEELAKHFTELYGKVITVDDAFEMISKRQVEFQDVEKVFKNMTSEGGVFYNMQAEMADTTIGRITALKSSIALMFNEIGESQQGTINWVIGFLKKLVDNWQYVAGAIKGVVAAYLAYQVATTTTMFITGAFKTTMAALAAGEVAATAATNSLTVSLAGLANAIRGVNTGSKFGWIGAIIGLVAGVATTWWSISSASEETEEQVGRDMEAIKQNVQQLQSRAEQLNRTVNKLGDAFKKAVDESNLTDQRLQLQKLIDLANEEYKMRIDVEVSGLSADDLQAQMAELKEKLLSINRYASMYATTMLEDARFDDLLTTFLPGLETKLQSLLTAYDKVGENLRAFNVPKDILLLKPDETALEAAERIYKTLANTYSYDRTGATPKLNGKYIEGANQTLATFLNDIRELALLDTKGYHQMQNLMLSLPTDNAKQLGILDEVMFKAFDLLVDQKEFDPIVLEYLINESNRFLSTDIGSAQESTVKDWQKRYNKYLLKLRDVTKEEVQAVFGNNFSAWADTNLDASGAFQHIKLIDASQAHRSIEEQKELIKGYLDDAKKIVQTYEQGIGGEGAYTEEQYNAAKLEMKQLSELYRFFGAIESNKKSITDRIKLIEEMHNKFNEVKKDVGDIESEADVRSSYADTFAEVFGDIISMDSIGFMTKQQVVDALKQLEPYAAAAGDAAVKALSKAISGFEAEIKIEGIKADNDAIKRDVQDIFDKYSISVELKKLQVPPDVAKALWGVDYIASSGLMGEVISKYTRNLSEEARDIVSKELANGAGANWEEIKKYIGDAQVEQLKKDIEKVGDLEEKDLKERMKKYIEYSRQSLGEMGKIRLEQVNKMIDIQETFRIYDTDTDDVKAIKKREGDRALERTIEDANNSLSKLKWEEFRKSETFSSLFSDLDIVSNKVLDDVITRLNNFKKQWKDLPIDQMKEVDDLLRKAERARDVEKGLGREKRRLRRNIRKDGRSLEDAQIDSMEAEANKSRLEEEIQMIDMINQAKAAGLTNEQIKLSLESSYHYLLEKDATALEALKRTNRGLIADEQLKINSAKNRIDDELDLRDIYEEQANAIKEIDNMANDLYKSFRDLHDVIASEDEELLVFFDAGMDMASLVMQTMAMQASLNAAAVSATGFGAALNTAMGVIGWVVMGVQLATKAITAIAEYNDKVIEKTVEAQQRALDDAIEKYEELEEAIDEAYSTEQFQYFRDQMIDNIDLAIEAQKKIIEARRSAKHSDEEGHEDWEALKEAEAALKDLEDRREEAAKDVYSRITDGILDSTLDAAKEFTEAWYEAFKETGDGLSGLEENFEEMFMNLAKNQAAQQITGAYVEEWKSALKTFIDPSAGDSELTPEEARQWAEQVKASFPQLSDALESFLGVIHEGLGGSGTNSLSELQKGIQGVTEQTAQVIESLLNSIRYYSMDSNAQLAQQTKVMTDMFSFIKGLSTSASNKNKVTGTVLKVVMA